jgi:hypothetical protein
MSLFGEVSDECRASMVGESGGEPKAVRPILPALHMSMGRDSWCMMRRTASNGFEIVYRPSHGSIL